MKIAWFTPFSTKSAIGKYSQIITEELAKTCEVDLWISDTAELLDTTLRVILFSSEGNYQESLLAYDYVIYNLGNYLDFHKHIYNISCQHPGLVILHDFVMQHFFVGYHYGKDEAQYIRDMDYYYGPEARRLAAESFKFKRVPLWETDEVGKYPLFEKALAGARGVIVHSHFFGERVRNEYLGPVGVLYLPAPFNAKKSDEASLTRQELGVPTDKLLCLTLGHVNPNKRLDKTLQALGENPELAQKIFYVVIGPQVHQDYANSLHKLVKKYGLQNSVRFLGYQSDAALYAHMKNADAFINLRYPIIEGASWSLVEQLYFGKPTVVTNAGFYRELPSDCVIKVDPDQEVADLTAALRRLVQEPEFRQDLGQKALAYAREYFHVQKYCREFTSLLREVDSAAPALNLIDSVGKEMLRMHFSHHLGACRSVAEKLALILKEP
jgi:glycosyltransferase involved in cell wall biosynthesis